jgi:cytochrome b6-f complex iron-sulfur subunit
MSVKKNEIKNSDTHNRRRFINRCLKWTGVLFCLSLLYPLIRFTSFHPKPEPRFVTVPAPLGLRGYHKDREFILFGGGTGENKKDKKPFAVSRICTHLGCKVNFMEDKQLIECPCHESQFTPHGEVVTGPATKNLTTYPVKVKRTKTGSVSSYIVTL